MKPQNVLVGRDRHAYLSDFGAGGESGGTLAYSPPERLSGRAEDHRGDVFALGVTLYEAVAGVQPFLPGSAVSTRDRFLRHHPPAANTVNTACR